MPATLLFRDDGNRANNTNLGVNWEERQNDWEIFANQFRSVAVAPNVNLALWKGIAPVDCEISAIDIEGGVPVLGNALALRVQSGATPDMYFAGFLGLSAGGTSALQIAKRISSVVTQIGSNVAVTRGAAKKLRFLIQSNSLGTSFRLRTYYDGVIAHDLTDVSITSAGLAGIYADVAVRRWDEPEVRGEFFFNFVPNTFEYSQRIDVEDVAYRSGFVQYNKIWSRPKLDPFRLGYEALTDTEKRDIQEFYMRRGGAFEPFLVQEPRQTNPTDQFFALGDGVTTKFKVLCDWAELITTKTNGIIDSPQPSKDFTTGIVAYTSAPAKGTVLTADITNARYRVRFMEKPRFRHITHVRWGTDIMVMQEKTLIDGVPA